MRILWFGRSNDDARDPDSHDEERAPTRTPAVQADRVTRAVRTPRRRTDDEVTLALSTLPRYHVLLRLRPQDAETAAAWANVLAPALGERRASCVVAEAARVGAALVVTCPRELAEHYRDALIRQALPCAIEPA